MSKLTFVAFLYIFALCGLFLGGGDLFLKIQFALGSEHGVMKSSDAAVVRAAKYAPRDPIRADVIYVTAKGTVPVHGKALGGEDVQRLARGEGIPLRYLKSNPHRVLYEGDELPAGVGWLVLGFLSAAVAVFAHRLLRREAGVPATSSR